MKSIKVMIFLSLFISVNLLFGQKYDLDTVIVEGNLVAFVERSDLKRSNLKSEKVIDISRGYFFFRRNEKCIKRNYEALHRIDRNQNAVFFFQNGGNFFDLNVLFFDGKLNALCLDEKLFPSSNSFSFKDKNYLYTCVPLKISCLRVDLGKKELVHIIAFNQYSFDSDKIPVYIVQEIIN